MKFKTLPALLLAVVFPAPAQPNAGTVAAFGRYVAAAEQRIGTEQSSPRSFLRLDSLPIAERNALISRLHQAEVIIEKLGSTPLDVPGGMIHHWVGTAFVPRVSVAQVLSLVQDYDHLARYYQPDVQGSRLIARNGDDFRIFMQLRKHKVVTVVLDTEYDVHYGRLDATHWFSTSHSTRIAEAGGDDHGFLWRLYTYWRFVEVDDGVIVQCEAISLTRDIPTGLGWMVGPFVTGIPRESLEFTMTATRRALTEH
jgi:hypothetical protein